MIVDDEADIVRLTGIIFEINNHKTTKVSSGDECLKKLYSGTVPDIILLDLMMPGISGYETCRKIKSDEKFRDIPVVILSAKSADKDIKEAYNEGADGYISKPFEPNDLLKKIENYYGGMKKNGSGR
jgi:CheY-like chemotaxis protein